MGFLSDSLDFTKNVINGNAFKKLIKKGTSAITPKPVKFPKQNLVADSGSAAPAPTNWIVYGMVGAVIVTVALLLKRKHK